MTMLKQGNTSIWTYAAEDRDVDDLIFGAEDSSARIEALCSDR